MIPILEATSNSISSAPTAASAAQTSSVARAGGFASTLAAAHDLSTDSQNATSTQEASNRSIAKNADAAINLRAPIPAAGTFQGKKFQNSNPVAASTVASLNGGVPGCIPAASQIAPPPPPSSPLQPSFLQPSFFPTLAKAVQPQAEVAAGVVESGLQVTAYGTTAQTAPVGYVALSPAVGRFDLVGSPGGIAGRATNLSPSLSMPGLLIPAVTTSQTNEGGASMVNGVQPSDRFSDTAALDSGTLPKLAADRPLAALSAVTGRITSNVVGQSPDSGNLPNGNQGGPSPIRGTGTGNGLGSAETTRISQAADPNVPGRTLHRLLPLRLCC